LARSRKPPPRQVRYFSVKIRMVRQVAGQRRGVQLVNDRIVQFEGHTESEARRRAHRYMKFITIAYHEQDGTHVRWTATILEVRQSQGTIEPFRARAVWDTTGRKRMKRGDVWIP
jgi:hypothetical protein